MLAALFMGLAPTIIRSIFHIDSGLVNGATAFLEPGAAAIVGFVLGRFTPRRTTLIGGVGVLVGTAVIVAGIAFQVLPLLWLGGIIGGVGFGASFSGALRILGPLAQPHERAELFAGVFLVAYLSFGIPAIITGQLVGPLGLLPTVLAYGAAILLAALVGLVTQLRQARRTA
jgi:MFS family permease